MSTPIPMIGKRIGRLVVVKDAGNTKTGMKMWECKCDCGATTVVRGTHLRQDKIKSCGCLRREETSKRTGTHRMKETRPYRIWKGMKARCLNPNSPAFKWYGGRGISVCEEWRNSFEAFYNHVSKLPRFGNPIYSLDRINNDGNYEPGNVRWATAKEQRHNQRCKIKKEVTIIKHGKRPTRAQKKFIETWGLRAENWLVTVDAPDRMELVHRHNDSLRKTIHKEVKERD